MKARRNVDLPPVPQVLNLYDHSTRGIGSRRLLRAGEGRNGTAEGDAPKGGDGPLDAPIQEPTENLPTSFRAVVDIDPARLGGSAGAISQEVVQRLASIMGSNVRVTLEIQADVPEGIPEKIERDISENCNTLKFRDYDFRGPR